MGNLLNRFGESAYKNLHDPFEDRPKSFQRVRTAVIDEDEKSAAAPEVTVKPTLVELKEKISEIPARKVKGRPKVAGSINSEKPWEAEGISRMTWYRRQKSKGEV